MQQQEGDEIAREAVEANDHLSNGHNFEESEEHKSKKGLESNEKNGISTSTDSGISSNSSSLIKESPPGFHSDPARSAFMPLNRRLSDECRLETEASLAEAAALQQHLLLQRPTFLPEDTSPLMLDTSNNAFGLPDLYANRDWGLESDFGNGFVPLVLGNQRRQQSLMGPHYSRQNYNYPNYNRGQMNTYFGNNSFGNPGFMPLNNWGHTQQRQQPRAVRPRHRNVFDFPQPQQQQQMYSNRVRKGQQAGLNGAFGKPFDPMDEMGGPLDNMRSLEHFLPQPTAKPGYMDGSDDSGGYLGRLSPKNFDMERFSRKVFVGGLPPDIDEDEITASFRRFGPLVVDWPHKAESKSYFPPKGYAFLLFQDEASVQTLIDACIQDEEKLYLCVSSPTIKDKPVQIRPWRLSDADFVLDASLPLDPRKTVFVGGVPRPLKAIELAMIMDRLYGGVCYAGIDTDPELKYPKGAGRVAFSNQQSYIAAISARFVQLQHGEIDKRVEVKPYVLDDQMCDECGGHRCGGKFAPFFCANVMCLQYYCEQCWSTIHSRPGREYHKPLVKEGADRTRAVPYRWC